MRQKCLFSYPIFFSRFGSRTGGPSGGSTTTPRRVQGGQLIMLIPRPAPESPYLLRRLREGSSRGERGNSQDRSVINTHSLSVLIQNVGLRNIVCVSVSLMCCGILRFFSTILGDKRSLHESVLRIPAPVKWWLLILICLCEVSKLLAGVAGPGFSFPWI